MTHSFSKSFSSTVLGSVSAAALAATFTVVPMAQVRAQSVCSSFTPMSGDTVTCTFDSDPGTNNATPITTAINAPGAENVILTITDPTARFGIDDIDASFSGGTPTIALGGGAQITIRNVSVGNVPVVGEAELSQEDLAQVFQEPYASFLTDFIGEFDGGATPTRAQLQQVIDSNGLTYMLADSDPLDDITTAFVAAFNDAGVPTTVGFDEDGDAFLMFEGEDGEIIDAFGFPASGAAFDAFSNIFADAQGSVISLGAPTDRSAIDPTVIERIATAPGTPAATVAGQNSLNLGVFGSDDGDIFAVGANGVDLAQGSVTTIRLFDDGIGVVGNGGAAVVLNAGGADASAVELILVPGAEIATLGNNGAAIRVNGGNAAVGIASDVGALTTLGDGSPLVSMTGGDSVLNLRLSELSTDATIEFDGAGNGPYSTAGNNSPLFQVSGDNSRVFLSSNQVGVRNESAGFVSLGDDSTIFDWQLGENGFVNADFLNGKASTSGDASNVLNLSTGATSSVDVLLGNVTLGTQGSNATAILVGGTSNSSITNIVLTANSVTTSGAGSLGVDVGSVSMIGSLTAVMNGGTIATSGANAHGARFAPSGASGSSVGTIDLQDAAITTSGDGAFGLVVGASAVDGSAADTAIDDFTITTSGRGGAGLQAALGANVSSASSFTMSTTTISTSGDLANGAVFTSAVGSTADTGSTVNGVVNTSVITTSGRFADALVIGENVTIYGPGAAAPIDGAAKLTVDTFEDFSATGLGSRGIQNNGVIEVTNTGITYGAGKTGRIANAGTINGAGGTAVTFAADTDDIFELQPQAVTIGTVDGAGGTDTFILGGEGTDTFDTDLLDTQYVNFEVFEKEDLSNWTLTSNDARAWEVRGGDLFVASGTNLTTDGANPVFTVTEGLSSANVDGTVQIIKTRGQVIINDGAAVNSAAVDVAAIVVDGNVITEDLPQVDGRPQEDMSVPVRDRFETDQTFSDVRIAGIVDTTANGAVGIQGRTVGDAAPVMTVSLEGDGRIQTIGADASAIAGAATGSNDITVLADGDSVISTSGARSVGIGATGGASAIEIVLFENASIQTLGADASAIANVGTATLTTVTADGGVSISSAGDNAHGIFVPGGGSAITMEFTQDVSITTAGANASAIRKRGRGSVFSLIAEGTSRLSTAGDNSTVLEVDDFDSSVAAMDFNLSADRTQQALLSEGANSDLVSIAANAEGQSTFVFSAEAADTAADVADFETIGDASSLLTVDAGDMSSLTVSLDNINAITRGEGSDGYQLATGDEGDLTLSLDGGSLAALGSNSKAVDLHVGANATLLVSVTNTVITTGGTDTAAIFTSAGAGADVTVFSESVISTTGADGVGLQAVGSIGGMNDIDVAGTIITSGARAHAVWLDQQAEDFALTGLLNTSGDNAKGIGADGSTFVLDLAGDSRITTVGLDSDAIWIGAEAQVPIDSAVINANGAITTSGNDASGIWVSTLAGDSFDDGLSESGDDLLAGTADITLAGSINTAGESGYGIAAEGTGITITVAQTGTIETTNTDGDGIWLDYGDVAVMGGMQDGTIAMNGSILTTGTMAEGIWVDRSGLTTGGTTIDVAGTIRTEGAQSHGISVFYGASAPMNGGDGGGIGDVGMITVSGTVEARGAGADGIRTYLDDGAATSITVEAGGDVFAPGDGDSGIYLTSLAGASGVATATITVDAATDTLSRGNVFASSGPAIAEGNDAQVPLFINTTLTVGGNVSSGGNDILAVDLGTGDDTVTITEDGFIGGSVQLGSGNDVMSVAGTVRSLSGQAVDTGAGNDEFIVLPTASILGGVDLGSGTDTLAFDGAAGTTGTIELLAETVPFAVDVERTEKRGAGTWIFEGQDVPRGANLAPTFVLEGTAVIRAQILGTDTTNAIGGRIEGTGGLGSLVNAGTFSPGEGGVGTFTIANDLTLQSTSTVEIDIAANGAADLIEVGDDAVLDGALVVNGVMYPTGFPNQQDYVILTAAETVSGTFASVSDNLPDVDISVAYGESDVTISYDRGQDESDKTIQANTVQSGLVDGRLFAETLRRRGVLMGAAGGFASGGNVQVAQNGQPSGLYANGKRYAVWASAMGAIADVADQPGRNGYGLGLGGIASGFDGFIPLDDAMVRVGAAFGYSRGDIDNAASGADVNTWHFGAHAVYEKDAFGLSGAVSYGIQDYDIQRVIELIGSPNVTASGDADGSVFSLSVGARYTVYESDTFKISPIAHVEHVSAKRDAYNETGAGILDLTVEAERFDRTFVGAGVRFEAESEGAGGITYKPQLDLMYEHAFGDGAAVVGSSTTNIQGIEFTTRGGDQSRNQVAVGAGIAMDITDRVSAHIRYDGNYASGFTSHRGSAGVSVSF